MNYSWVIVCRFQVTQTFTRRVCIHIQSVAFQWYVHICALPNFMPKPFIRAMKKIFSPLNVALYWQWIHTIARNVSMQWVLQRRKIFRVFSFWAQMNRAHTDWMQLKTLNQFATNECFHLFQSGTLFKVLYSVSKSTHHFE